MKNKPNFFTHENAVIYLKAVEVCSQCKYIKACISRYCCKIISVNNKSRKMWIVYIIQKFETNQLDGSQVKQLDIEFYKLSTEQYSRITAIFFNVTRCSSIKKKIFHREKHITDSPDPMLRWKDTIKAYSNLKCIYNLQNELNNNIFSALTELELDVEAYDDWKHGGFEALRLLPILKNTPSLRVHQGFSSFFILDQDFCTEVRPTRLPFPPKCSGINLEFLEGLHESCSYIRSLVLTDAVIIVDDEHLPIPITPAMNVLNLEMNSALMLDKRAVLLDYILNKYKSLCRLCLSIDIGVNEEAVKHKLQDFNKPADDDNNTEDKVLDSFRSTLEAYRAGNHYIHRN